MSVNVDDDDDDDNDDDDDDEDEELRFKRLVKKFVVLPPGQCWLRDSSCTYILIIIMIMIMMMVMIIIMNIKAVFQK